MAQLEGDLAAEMSAINNLYRLSTQLLRLTDLHTALEQILDGCMEIVGAPMGMVQVYDDARKVLAVASQRGFDQESLDHFQAVSVQDSSACTRALAGGRVIIEDVDLYPEFAHDRAIAKSLAFAHAISCPGEPQRRAVGRRVDVPSRAARAKQTRAQHARSLSCAL